MSVHPLVSALRHERERQDISQHDLARLTGWARRTIAAAEVGATNPTLVFVEDYAGAVGVRVALVRREGGAVVEVQPRVASRRECDGCGVSYQVTRRGVIRKHGCTVKEEQ